MYLEELGLAVCAEGWGVPEPLKAGIVVAMEGVIIAHTLCTKVNCSQTPVHTHVHRNKNHVKFKDVNLERGGGGGGERQTDM